MRRTPGPRWLQWSALVTALLLAVNPMSAETSGTSCGEWRTGGVLVQTLTGGKHGKHGFEIGKKRNAVQLTPSCMVAVEGSIRFYCKGKRLVVEVESPNLKHLGREAFLHRQPFAGFSFDVPDHVEHFRFAPSSSAPLPPLTTGWSAGLLERRTYPTSRAFARKLMAHERLYLYTMSRHVRDRVDTTSFDLNPVEAEEALGTLECWGQSAER